ncbi:hypothetical protein ACHAPT_005624 [Fusarium lateritium]
MATQDKDPSRLEGTPFVVDQAKTAFSKLTLKTAELDVDGCQVKSRVATEELRFTTWIVANDANKNDSSLEHWRISRPDSYATLSYLLVNINRLLESLNRLFEKSPTRDKRMLADLLYGTGTMIIPDPDLFNGKSISQMIKIIASAFDTLTVMFPKPRNKFDSPQEEDITKLHDKFRKWSGGRGLSVLQSRTSHEKKKQIRSWLYNMAAILKTGEPKFRSFG